ncbi:MAG TPA: hypothetical protein VMH28_03795 [Candidatus Acidoferrales bacterium]|nr:hypothetical protein [Candidatus Acidoferrales bacterium]
MESGSQEIYVQPFPELGAKIRISTQTGGTPRWSRNGRELFYWSFLPVQQLLAVVNWFEELRHRVPVKR